MATLGEFSSLLQLGFGVGAGLSVFRVPIDYRLHKMRKQVEGALTASQGVNTDQAKQRVFTFSSLKLRLHVESDALERILQPFLWFTAAGAIANWGLLVCASAFASYVLTAKEQVTLVFVSVGYFIVIGIVLEVVARHRLGGIQAEIESAMQP